MSSNPATVLGFDFGKKRIGVAVGQTLTGDARALTTVRTRNDKPDWEAIDTLVRQWQPALLVVGLPISLEGGDHPLAEEVRRFTRELHQRYALPVNLIDERLSSHEAAHIAQASSGRATPASQNAKETVDRLAAQVILKTWLAEQAHHRLPS